MSSNSKEIKKIKMDAGSKRNPQVVSGLQELQEPARGFCYD